MEKIERVRSFIGKAKFKNSDKRRLIQNVCGESFYDFVSYSGHRISGRRCCSRRASFHCDDYSEAGELVSDESLYRRDHI
jgi:hypothetical protein